MACKLTSKGTLFYYDSDGSDPYTLLTSVQSITGPNITMETLEQTELASSGGWKEFCASFKDGGECTVQLFSKRSVLTVVYNTIFAATTAYYYRIKFPLESGDSNESKIEFQAWMVGIGNEVPEKGNVMTPVSLKITGAVTYTAGS